MEQSYEDWRKSEDAKRLAFNDWCKTEEARELAAKVWQTESFDGVYIAVYNIEDDLPEQSCVEAAIHSIQSERKVSLKTLFLDLHNKSEGFKYNPKNVELFLICQKEILSRAYGVYVPCSAYISCY